MLDSHPDMAIPEESHFLATFGGRRRRWEHADGFDTWTRIASHIAALGYIHELMLKSLELLGVSHFSTKKKAAENPRNGASHKP